jgi:hypothetical protein
MDFVNSFKSYVLFTLLLACFATGILGAVDPTLPLPTSVTNINPNQRTFLTISWSPPANGYFYPFYNIYYRRFDDPVFKVLPNIQGLFYKLTAANTANYIQPATQYVIAVSGQTAPGYPTSAESTAVQIDLTKTATTPSDPKRDQTKAISAVSCVVNTRHNVYCSWTPGLTPLSRVNIRIKCIKPNGDNRILRKFVFGTARAFIEVYDTPRNSVCKIEVHPLYQAVPTTPQINNVYGKKYKFTVTTPNDFPLFP